jgi:hypothetical protein
MRQARPASGQPSGPIPAVGRLKSGIGLQLVP